MTDPTQRFSNRVENYQKYRPYYPPAIIETLRSECGLAPESVVADIGSGTGILTELFLANGNTVYAVEPNREMLLAGERRLGGRPGFHNIAGRAEATMLPDRSVDFVAVGQAFHWFDREAARSEFCRIFKRGGWVVLVWNDRDSSASDFSATYEQLVRRYAIDYQEVTHRQITDAILSDFYRPGGFRMATFRNPQPLDYDGLRGRLLSSSYSPLEDRPNHAPMLAELETLFRAHEISGRVVMEYCTEMYYGRIE
jgi:SAM-dependent methyltransferase